MEKNVTEESRNATETLRRIFRDMDPAKAQEIRQCYYAVMDNLRPLADLLEIEDLNTGDEPGGILIHEHLLAITAFDAMSRSQLGAVL
ncbi:hypothetical protein Poly41_29940 [Novipirellula artificiosorum]|uniref:Uncharacterized protein n=1 Tax=Novipirellula artificiosorum TaxID=2528016 RepID=A0A5C6DRN2_9BACT|nr:hypothetical protein Poly41_29940 [Novipirellula artificiosorum]